MVFYAKATKQKLIPQNNTESVSCSTIEGKCVIVIEIYPGNHRPYYIKSMGKEQGTYIRIAGSTRHADDVQLKELECNRQINRVQ